MIRETGNISQSGVQATAGWRSIAGCFDGVATRKMYKELFSLLAIVLSFLAFAPYIRSILQGKTRPHLFSWIIWSISTLIVFFAQLADGAGVGAWAIGFSGVLTVYVAWLAWRHSGDYRSTAAERCFLAVALLTLPLWYMTSEPLWAVVILTAVDSLGFGPTFSKALERPFEEDLSMYVITAVRNLFVIVALEHYSLTTVLFPAVMTVFALLLVAVVAVRRRKSLH